MYKNVWSVIFSYQAFIHNKYAHSVSVSLSLSLSVSVSLSLSIYLSVYILYFIHYQPPPLTFPNFFSIFPSSPRGSLRWGRKIWTYSYPYIFFFFFNHRHLIFHHIKYNKCSCGGDCIVLSILALSKLFFTHNLNLSRLVLFCFVLLLLFFSEEGGSQRREGATGRRLIYFSI